MSVRKDFKKAVREGIPVAMPGQIWLAADGGKYGHMVVASANGAGDVIVKPFTASGFDAATDIDAFKLSYRYYLVDAPPSWMPTS